MVITHKMMRFTLRIIRAAYDTQDTISQHLVKMYSQGLTKG